MLRALASLSRFHIIFIAIGGSLVFGWLLTGSFQPALAALVGIDWFLVNFVNRVVDQKEDRVNRISQTDFAGRHGRGMLLAALLIFSASFSVHLFWMPLLALPRLGYHFLGLIYNFKLIPGFGGGKVRLKDLYFFKNSASCCGFLITLFAYPLVAGNLAPGVTALYVIVLAAFFALFELSFEAIYDMRDLAGDRAAGVASYPVIHGEAWTARLVILLNLAAIYVLLLAAAFQVIAWKEFIMSAACALQLAIFIRASRRGVNTTDCICITWIFAAQLAAYCIWIMLGLPLTLPFDLSPVLVVEFGLVIIGFFCYAWMKEFYGPRRYLAIYILSAVGAWMAEHSCIALYDFYHYSQEWHGFIGHVPLAIVLIWPMVILSANHLTERLGFKGVRALAISTFFVVLEAVLIEVICLQAGLWSWRGVGIFGAPIIGMLGWGAYALGVFWANWKLKGWPLLLLPFAGLFSAHLLLQILWRAGFRDISSIPLPDTAILIATALGSLAATLLAVRARRRRRIAMLEVLPRILAAQLIYYLLFVSQAPAALSTMCLLYVPPYLALFTLEWRMTAEGKG